MNEGKSQEELAAEIRLPEQYAVLPYLGEFYGCVEWTVRAVYTAYLGWFDGNPTHLHPLAPKKYTEKNDCPDRRETESVPGCSGSI